MIADKRVNKFVIIVVSIAAVLCLAGVIFAPYLKSLVGSDGVTIAYENTLFNTDEIIQVNILMDDEAWQTLLDNAMSEEYYQCDVEINGETYYRVGIRPKGNTSLSSIASDNTTDRYSLKLEFDHYVDEQTCCGLDKLILNNNYADATNMKEALVYDMYQFIGADASLYNYAKVSVNGEYWGVYLALEAVDDSFSLRNYGAQSGELYKPESVGGRNGADEGGNMSEGITTPDSFDPTQQGDGTAPEIPEGFDPTQQGNGTAPEMPEGFDPTQQGNGTASEIPEGFDPTQQGNGTAPEMPDNRNFSQIQNAMGGAGGVSSGNGADLNYSDDELDSYSTIWDGEVTNTTDADHKRVIEALKNIEAGTNLEKYMDVDNLLKYAAVHIFSVNEDSLSGSMTHNYYLYEYDGQLNLLPWDYNLAFGGMGQSGDATSLVNDPIDDAFNSTDFFDTLLADEGYHSRYYEYLQKLVDEYINGGAFDAFYNRVRGQIDELVKTDPTAFYDYDEYEAALDVFYQVIKLRGESIRAQIDGSIASTASQRTNEAALIDASSLDLSLMGQMNNNKMGGGRPDAQRNQNGNDQNAVPSQNESDGQNTDNPTMPGNMPNGTPGTEAETDDTLMLAFSTQNSGQGNAPQMPMGGGFQGQNGGTFSPNQTPGDFQGGQMPGGLFEEGSSGDSQFNPQENTGAENNTESQAAGEKNQQNSSFGTTGGSFQPGSTGDSSSQTPLLYGISALVIMVGLLFAGLYHRRGYRL